MKTLAVICAVMVLRGIPLFSQVVAEGPFAGLDLAVVPVEYRRMIVQAGQDCVEVEAQRPPKFAKPSALEELDGGTRQFVGDGYVIVVRHSLFLPVAEGKAFPGYSYGYELYWGPGDVLEKHPGIPAVVSKVWFLPNRQRPTPRNTAPNQLPDRTAPTVTSPASQASHH